MAIPGQIVVSEATRDIVSEATRDIVSGPVAFEPLTGKHI